MDNAKHCKILVVDDSEANRLLLSFMLEELEFEIDEAKNGEIAVEHAMEYDYAAVFMDLNMPLMGGLEATTILRNLNYEQPIFACSAEDNPEKITQLLASGFDDFLPKPIEPDDISKILTQHKISKQKVTPANNQTFQHKLDQLGNRFINNLPVMIAKIEQSIHHKSFSELKHIAHKLKGTASQFGFENISKIGRDIESAINKEKISIALEKSKFLITELKKIKMQNKGTNS